MVTSTTLISTMKIHLGHRNSKTTLFDTYLANNQYEQFFTPNLGTEHCYVLGQSLKLHRSENRLKKLTHLLRFQCSKCSSSNFNYKKTYRKNKKQVKQIPNFDILPLSACCVLCINNVPSLITRTRPSSFTMRLNITFFYV